MRREQRGNHDLQLLENPPRTVPSHNRNAHQLHNVPAPVAHTDLQLCPADFNAEKHTPYHAGNLEIGQLEFQSTEPNPVENEPDWKSPGRPSLPPMEEALKVGFVFKTNPVRFAETHVLRPHTPLANTPTPLDRPAVVALRRATERPSAFELNR
jgi:hypothetical protein